MPAFARVMATKIWSQVGLHQTAHSWATAGVLLGVRMRHGVAFETIAFRQNFMNIDDPAGTSTKSDNSQIRTSYHGEDRRTY